MTLLTVSHHHLQKGQNRLRYQETLIMALDIVEVWGHEWENYNLLETYYSLVWQGFDAASMAGIPKDDWYKREMVHTQTNITGILTKICSGPKL